MRTLAKRDLQTNLDVMLRGTLDILKDLHIVHKKTAFEELLDTKLPGAEITIAKLINNLFNMIKPLIAIARKTYPAFFAVLDWAEMVVRRLLAH